MLQQVILREHAHARWLEFSAPRDVLVATEPAEVLAVLREAERRVADDGLWAAGFVTFDAAPAFDTAFVAHREPDLPLACLGLFAAPDVRMSPPEPPATTQHQPAWYIDEDAASYRRKIERIRHEIALGNTYQVNYTLRYRCDASPDARALFAAIASTATYAACVETDDQALVSASPELFFRLDGRHLTCQPMKGTAARGMRLDDDRERRDALYVSAKDRAENVMITDMIRNDMGRIADPGSVEVTRLFNVQKHATVWQMTSTVTGMTDAGLTGLFEALFPCASVTGAPKVSSMRLIHELEATPRGAYTGAIGYFGPGRQAQFNVAIRTATVDRRGGVYGVGGGIVWDSRPDAEYLECRLKSRVLTGGQPATAVTLLETLRWTPDAGVFLLERHLDRLAESARYFDIPFDRDAILAALAEATQSAEAPRRLRLLVDDLGSPRVESARLPTMSGESPLRLRLALQPVDRDDPFLYHKTTHRAVYDDARAGVAACDDVLLWNAEGWITETTVANVFVPRDDSLLTPPVDCGLLAGTMRAEMLATGEAREQAVRVDELHDGQPLVLANSVRGRYAAIFVR